MKTIIKREYKTKIYFLKKIKKLQKKKLFLMRYYIIIPAYNEEAFMAITLQSLVEQTVLPSKVIVVNDNSTDSTPEIVTEFSQKYPFISLVNKVSSAIHLRFDIAASSLPAFYKERLLTASHHLITGDGVVVIKAQEYRSQEMNREAALQRLVNLIQELSTVEKARRATRPTRASKERRLEGKARRSSTKSMRGKVQ